MIAVSSRNKFRDIGMCRDKLGLHTATCISRSLWRYFNRLATYMPSNNYSLYITLPRARSSLPPDPYYYSIVFLASYLAAYEYGCESPRTSMEL